MPWTLRLTAAALLAALVSTAHAQEQEADRLIREGLELRRQGRNQEALPSFQRAYSLLPTSRAAAQLGFVEQALGLSLEAEKHVSSALADEGDPFVRRNRSAIVEALATIRAGLGSVLAEVRPSTATLTVNGVLIPPRDADNPIYVLPGKTVIEAQAPGFQRQSATVTLLRGARERVIIKLPPLTSQAETQVSAETRSPPRNVRQGRDSPQREEPSRRLAGTVILSAGAIALAAGIAGMLIANSKIGGIERDARSDRPYDPGKGNFGTYRTMGQISFGLTAASVLAGGWLYWSGTF